MAKKQKQCDRWKDVAGNDFSVGDTVVYFSNADGLRFGTVARINTQTGGGKEYKTRWRSGWKAGARVTVKPIIHNSDSWISTSEHAKSVPHPECNILLISKSNVPNCPEVGDRIAMSEEELACQLEQIRQKYQKEKHEETT